MVNLENYWKDAQFQTQQSLQSIEMHKPLSHPQELSQLNREKNMVTILTQDMTFKLRTTGEIVAMEKGDEGTEMDGSSWLWVGDFQMDR